MIAIEELEALVGKPFPGGAYTIEPYRNWLLLDSTEGTPSLSGSAFPMEIYFGALDAMGISLDELFAWVGSSAAEGPMFGEAELEQRRALQVGETFTVRGHLTSVVRKEGKRAGVFDIVGFQLELVGADGKVAAVSTNSFVFPRRD